MRGNDVPNTLVPIKGNLEAWVLFLWTLPGFPKSLPELVSTAGRALR